LAGKPVGTYVKLMAFNVPSKESFKSKKEKCINGG
jgi:hypothetical protein